MIGRVRYFAYGSNMLVARIRAADRAPSARPISVGALPEHALRFHKRGADGSGKCTIIDTGRGRDVVYGVLFEIEPADRPRLHEAEGLGDGYRVRHVGVRTPRGPRTAYTYRAQPGWIDETLRPFAWYRDLVLAGAREHGLPGSYLETLAKVPARVDPHRRRARSHRQLLR